MAWHKRTHMGHYVDVYQEFFCDFRSDIDKLPKDAAAGSTAWVHEDGSIWVINSEGRWKEFGTEDEGDGG